MAIKFERLVSRGLALRISREMDIAGVKMTVDKLLKIVIIGSFAIFIGGSIALLYVLKLPVVFAALGGLGSAALFIVVIIMILEYKIDGRKTKLEQMLPDYLQIASANLRSGIAFDRALLLSARPEFGFLSEDVKEMNRRIFGGENFETALGNLSIRYRSYQLSHAIRMMLEALRYGGAMADLLEQISKDMRNQQLIQKEVAGQLLMYSIFIAFAGLIAAPVLYGLTSQMIVVTDKVWNGILAQNPGGLPTTGISFLKPSPPKISPETYGTFSILSIMIITAFASLIMSAIASGSMVRGLRLTPLFVVMGLVIFLIIKTVIASMFAGISGGI